MTDWVLSVEGTEAGHRAALMLALAAAFLHALFGAMQKGRYDPWTSRTVIDTGILLMSAPVALFVVPIIANWVHDSGWRIVVVIMLSRPNPANFPTCLTASLCRLGRRAPCHPG